MEESMSPFLVRDFGAQNCKAIQRIHKAWETPLRKDQELRGIRNGIIGGYHEWLKVHVRGLDWLAKLKVVSEENFEAPEEDEEVRKTVNDAVADDSSTTASSSDASAESTATDEGGNPYPEGSPYPGHEDFYDETSYGDPYGDGYGEDGSAEEDQGASSDSEASSSEPPAAPAQPPPPTDEELRRVTITVSSDPGKDA